jgi:hypothetical protein
MDELDYNIIAIMLKLEIKRRDLKKEYHQSQNNLLNIVSIEYDFKSWEDFKGRLKAQGLKDKRISNVFNTLMPIYLAIGTKETPAKRNET